MERRDRVGDAHLKVSALSLGLIGNDLHVAKIIQRIEDANNINAVSDHALYKFPHDIVRIVTVSDQILSANQHLQLRFLDPFANFTKALPRILIQETHRGVKRRAPPHFKRVVPHLIHGFTNGEHILRLHAGCHGGLMRIS